MAEIRNLFEEELLNDNQNFGHVDHVQVDLGEDHLEIHAGEPVDNQMDFQEEAVVPPQGPPQVDAYAHDLDNQGRVSLLIEIHFNLNN